MSELKILPVRKLKEPKRKRKIHKVLPQPEFLCCVSSGIGAGKTNLLLNCLYRFYAKYFDHVWWISPTVLNDKTAWMLKEDETIMLVSDLSDLDDILLGIQEKQMEDDENEEDGAQNKTSAETR